MENKTIFSFDIGTGSLGTCVRKEKEILDLSVDLLPSDYATLKEAQKRRRQIRTRIAHKEREKWWKERAKAAGIEIPETGHLDEKGNFVKPDERMSREFPKDGDNTIYNSALLRIALLQGKKLEGWQIFKAIWSSIQHRGYDSNIPWISEPKRNTNEDNLKNKKDEEENKERVKRYREELERIFGKKEEFYYPCYYEAYKMGIWSPDDPNNLNKKISDNPQAARNKGEKVDLVTPRELVEKELKDMLINTGIKENLDFILWGPAKSKYATYNLKDYKKFRGKNWEWQGLISQKTPRFDNRIISKCILIPRLNVCKAKDQLNKEVTFLMQLKNVRYFSTINGEEKRLNNKEINEIFEKFKDKLKITKPVWTKYVKEKLKGDYATPEKIEAPKASGRSSFCRPALRIIKELILSGKKPSELYSELTSQNTNTDPQKGLIKEDYNFLLKLTDDYNFYVPDTREDDAELDSAERINKINELISKISNPVVRHRLKLFYDKLEDLKKKYGEPEKIIIEFVRDPEEGFYGKKKREKIISEQKKKREENDSAYKEVKSLGLKGKNSVLKVKLFREQNALDIYDGQPIKSTEIDNYEIDHIVPREDGGPDAYMNKVLTSRENNESKGKKTPYEWLKSTDKWNSYLERVKKLKIIDKKKSLLTSPDAKDLVEKYTQLAETAHIAKLSQRICHLFFGWGQGTKGSIKRVIIANGSLTAKMRNYYQLNRILHPDINKEEYIKIISSGEIDEKNRANPRHHALDALVLSMLPEIKMNDKNKDFFPIWFTPEYCKQEIEKCFPKWIRHEKPKLAETIYGLRRIKGSDKYVFVNRRIGDVKSIKGYYDIKTAKKYLDRIFSPEIQKDFREKLNSNPTQEEWKQFLDKYSRGGKPKKILLKEGKPIDYEDIKDFLDGKVKNYGEFIKGKMPGQFLKQKKDSYGYVVYKNDKGKWIREPIYAFESPYSKLKEIKDKHPQSYYFRTKMLIEIQKDCEVTLSQIKKDGGGRVKSIKTTIKAGRYHLNSINKLSTCKIEDFYKNEYVVSLNKIMEIGKMVPIS